MTSALTKVLAALAVVAVLGWVGPQAARAQRSYPSGSAGDTGFTWDEAFRYDPVRNPFGSREPETPRRYSPGRVASPGTYSPAAALANYYSGTPPSDFVSSDDYSYGTFAPPAPGNAARIRLIVPADAQVWFGDMATRQTGAVRNFESPALTFGKSYTYDVKVQWTENGKEMTRRRAVGVSANSSVTVDFTQQ
jgi:uncharacterized protein (TIGR03000 family)